MLCLPASVISFMLNIPNGRRRVYSNGRSVGRTTTPNSPYIQGAASAAADQGRLRQRRFVRSLAGATAASPCRTPTFNNQAGTFHTPYYEQWSLGIQQAIGDKTSLSLGYVGNHGVRIPIRKPRV